MRVPFDEDCWIKRGRSLQAKFLFFKDFKLLKQNL